MLLSHRYLKSELSHISRHIGDIGDEFVVMDSKKSLREEIIAKRQQIVTGAASDAAKKIEDFLFPLIPADASVALYCAIRGEVDVRGLLKKLCDSGHKVALSAIQENTKILKFLDCSCGTPLIAGKYGIACPQPHLAEIIPDVVIVPLVAFDKSGNRLGYGGGYYDATLAHLRSRNEKLLVIGVAYAMQRTENIPTHSGDQKMDMVVTEEGIE